MRTTRRAGAPPDARMHRAQARHAGASQAPLREARQADNSQAAAVASDFTRGALPAPRVDRWARSEFGGARPGAELGASAGGALADGAEVDSADFDLFAPRGAASVEVGVCPAALPCRAPSAPHFGRTWHSAREIDTSSESSQSRRENRREGGGGGRRVEGAGGRARGGG